MKFGVMMFATDYAIRVDELARAAEERGFESLWLPEHTHIPASRRSPWPGGPELPREYWHTHDLFVALAYAAAATTRLRIATGICLLIERDTITTAKAVASLDSLSNGRVIFGIGGGWNAEEMENHGTEFKTRWRKLREQVAALKHIWAEDEPAFAGEFVEFEPIWSWPKPVQKPHPPILLGGHSHQTLQRVVDYCDGWMPIAARADTLARDLQTLRHLASEAGRAPESLSLSIYGAPADTSRIAKYRDLGTERCIFGLPSEPRDQILPLLDRYAEIMREFAPVA